MSPYRKKAKSNHGDLKTNSPFRGFNSGRENTSRLSLKPLNRVEEYQIFNALKNHWHDESDNLMPPYKTLKETTEGKMNPKVHDETRLSRKRCFEVKDKYGRTFNDWMTGITNNMSPTVIHDFVVNNGFGVDTIDLMSHLLDFLYDPHQVDVSAVVAKGGSSKTIKARNNTHYSIKALGVLYKIACNSKEARPSNAEYGNWQEFPDGRIKDRAEIIAKYLTTAHQRWKPIGTWKFNVGNLFLENLYTKLNNQHSSLTHGIHDPVECKEGQKKGIAVQHFRAIYYLFDITGDLAPPMYGLSKQWQKSINLKKDRIYTSKTENQKKTAMEDKVYAEWDEM